MKTEKAVKSPVFHIYLIFLTLNSFCRIYSCYTNFKEVSRSISKHELNVFTVLLLKSYFKNSLIIHEQNTKEIIAVKESLYVIKHT